MKNLKINDKVKFKTYGSLKTEDTGIILKVIADKDIGTYYFIKPDNLEYDRIVRTENELIK